MTAGCRSCWCKHRKLGYGSGLGKRDKGRARAECMHAYLIHAIIHLVQLASLCVLVYRQPVDAAVVAAERADTSPPVDTDTQAVMPDDPSSATIDNTQYVLIVAQGRTGSTMLTDMLSMNRTDIFGVYEPFHDYPDVTTDEKQLADHNIPSGLNWQSLFDCTFTEDPDVLGAVGWRGQGRHKLADQIKHLRPWPTGGRRWGTKPRPFREERNFRLQPGVGKAGFDFRYARYVKEACRASRIRVVKTIRLGGPLLEHFVDNNSRLHEGSSNLKVIHLVRHPINVAHSWLRFTSHGRWKHSIDIFDIDSRTRLMCRKSGDIIFGLNSVVPMKNQLIVRFEDLTANPISTMQTVFEFIGVQFTDKDIEAIRNEINRNHGPAVNDHNVVGKFGVFGDNAVRAVNFSRAKTGNLKRVQLNQETVTACGPLVAVGNYTLS